MCTRFSPPYPILNSRARRESSNQTDLHRCARMPVATHNSGLRRWAPVPARVCASVLHWRQSHYGTAVHQPAWACALPPTRSRGANAFAGSWPPPPRLQVLILPRTAPLWLCTGEKFVPVRSETWYSGQQGLLHSEAPQQHHRLSAGLGQHHTRHRTISQPLQQHRFLGFHIARAIATRTLARTCCRKHASVHWRQRSHRMRV